MKLDIARSWNGKQIEHPSCLVRVESTTVDLTIHVDAPFFGDPPPPLPAGPTPGLWNHEVVEVFLVGPSERYLEIELGPHGHHLVLMLEGYRNVVAQALPIDFSARVEGERWHGEARIAHTMVPEPLLRANAFAIHGTGETRVYAAHHPLPGDVPDFHQTDRYPRVETVVDQKRTQT